MSKVPLENLKQKKEDCSGCSACVAICPKQALQMKNDREGFLYPVVDEEKCIHCGLCEEICPISQRESKENVPQKVYAIKNKQDIIRKNSASGGVFFSVARKIIQNKGVVYGVIFNEKLETVHIRSEHIDECKRMCGSKYAQSKIQDIFLNVKDDLIKGRQVLFTGTPCQVAGLKASLRKEYKNLMTLDLFCHGVLSPLILKESLNYIKTKKGSRIKKINFRVKQEDWINQRWGYELENSKKYIDDVFMQSLKKLYYGHVALRPSCHTCKFANLNRVGELSIGDYWGIDAVLPNFRDSLGVSCILVNNQKGEELLTELNNEFEIQETELKYCIQPQLQHPTEISKYRNEFWDVYFQKGFQEAFKKYGKLSKKEFVKASIPIQLRHLLKKQSK